MIQRLTRLKKLSEPSLPSAPHRFIPRGYVRFGRNIIPATPSKRLLHRENAGFVTDVYDGSVMRIRLKNNAVHKVKLLGVDAPAFRSGGAKDECFAEESRRKLRRMIYRKQVQLIEDIDYAFDNYHRLLRIVYQGEMDVNAEMIKNGYAFANDEIHARTKNYKTLEKIAKSRNLGLWSEKCQYQ